MKTLLMNYNKFIKFKKPLQSLRLERFFISFTSASNHLCWLYWALHQRQGQAPSTGSFSDRFLINSPAISTAQNAHTQAVVFEVAKAVRTPLNQLHFAVKTFCDAVIPGKPKHSGHFFAPIMQRLAQGAQRREGRFLKLLNFIGSTPKTGASPFNGQFFRQVSDQFPSHLSSTKRAHAGGSFRSYGSHTHAAESTSFCGENLL